MSIFGPSLFFFDSAIANPSVNSLTFSAKMGDELMRSFLVKYKLKMEGVSKVFNDGRREFRAFHFLSALHLTGKIVGDGFV